MTKRIVVAGDIASDFIIFPKERVELGDGVPDAQNWQMFPSHGELRLPGGAALTADLIGQLITNSDGSAKLAAEVPADRQIRSFVHLGLFHRTLKAKAEKAKDRVWRVKERGGYSAPAQEQTCGSIGTEDLWMDTALMVLDDAGNGFRDCSAGEKLVAEAANRKIPILLKMSRPIVRAIEAPLLKAVRATRTLGGPVILVLDMWNLRADGMDVSVGLSWERTATDFACALLVDQRFAGLRNCADFILVRTGLEGALLVETKTQRPEKAIQLLYDPSRIEGDCEEETPGKMVGYGSAFVAGLVHAVVCSANSTGEIQPELLRKATLAGLLAARRMALNGYGSTDEKGGKEPKKPCIADPGAASPDILDITAGLQKDLYAKDCFAWTYVPAAAAWWKSSPPVWRILNQMSSLEVRKLGLKILRDPRVRVDAAGIPVARFGDLCAIDRFEIEGYRALRWLVREYMQMENPPQPLCVAVFGQPGCGKSFGVKEIAKVVMGEKPEILTFNLSEFEDVDELKRALHLVHDKARNGVVPLVFFDEFDCEFGGKLGWLKHLLAPMQDGTFRDAEHEHPVGKAIFIFAGGTSHAFADFVTQGEGEGKAEFVAKKGPDFVGRLRGHVNVVGPCARAASDFAASLRRAMVFRYNLGEHAKRLTAEGHNPPDIPVREEVAYALLYTPMIWHGLRSIDALIQMSRLSDVREFGPSALPSRAQLNLHLDAGQFHDLLSAASLVLDENNLTQLAQAAHEGYRQANWLELARRENNDASKLPWPAGLKRRDGTVDSNFQQVELIPLRVTSSRYQVVKKDLLKAFSAAESFTPRQLATLAREEHARWIAEKENAGWRYGPGPGKDDRLRLHADMVDWAALPSGEQRKDLDAMARIPNLLAGIGYAMTEIRPPSPAAFPPGTGRGVTLKDDERPGGESKYSDPEPSFYAYAIVETGQKILVCGEAGKISLPGGPIGPDQRADIGLVQLLEMNHIDSESVGAAGKHVSARLRYVDCEIRDGEEVRKREKCALFFDCDLIDETGGSIANPDWTALIKGSRWESSEGLSEKGSLDPFSSAMLKRQQAWKNRGAEFK